MSKDADNLEERRGFGPVHPSRTTFTKTGQPVDNPDYYRCSCSVDEDTPPPGLIDEVDPDCPVHADEPETAQDQPQLTTEEVMMSTADRVKGIAGHLEDGGEIEGPSDACEEPLMKAVELLREYRTAVKWAVDEMEHAQTHGADIDNRGLETMRMLLEKDR